MILTPLQRKFILRWYSSFPGGKEEMFWNLAKNRLVEQGGNIAEVPKGDDPMPHVGPVDVIADEFSDAVPPMITPHTDRSNKPSPDTRRGVPFKEGEKLPVINKVKTKPIQPFIVDNEDATPEGSPSTDMDVPVIEGVLMSNIKPVKTKAIKFDKADYKDETPDPTYVEPSRDVPVTDGETIPTITYGVGTKGTKKGKKSATDIKVEVDQ